MKTLKKYIFNFYYQNTIDSASKVQGIKLTTENKIHIGLTILCQIYEQKRVTKTNLKSFFSELGNFFIYEDLDKSFGNILKNIDESYHIINAGNYEGRKINANTLKGIFEDFTEYFKDNNEEIYENFEFIKNDYDLMDKHNLKFVQKMIDFKSYAA